MKLLSIFTIYQKQLPIQYLIISSLQFGIVGASIRCLDTLTWKLLLTNRSATGLLRLGLSFSILYEEVSLLLEIGKVRQCERVRSSSEIYCIVTQ